MAKYLVTITETYRVDTEVEAQQLIEEAKNTRSFELKKYSATNKNRKEKKEIVDEWINVVLTKSFNDEKEPNSLVHVNYEVNNYDN